MNSDLKIEKWPMPPEENASTATDYRNAFAKKIQTWNVQEIYQIYTRLNPPEVKGLIRTAERVISKKRIKGIGAELGAGTALFSSVLAQSREVERIYAVESVPEVVELLQPKIIRAVLKSKALQSKIIRVVGSFENMNLMDNSLDFVIEFASWHHSNHLGQSVLEAFRVLKSGGVVLGFDRFQPDSLTREEIDALLEQKYSRQWLEAHGYPLDQKITRGMNGEHEYRMEEWTEAFTSAGFEIVTIRSFVKSADPFSSIRDKILGLPAKRGVGRPWNEIKKWIKQALLRTPYSPCLTTCFLLRKP